MGRGLAQDRQDDPKMGPRWHNMAPNWFQVGEHEVKMGKIRPKRPRSNHVKQLRKNLCFFMGSRLIGRPKQAQLRPKMDQDRVKMAKMGGN